MTSETRRGQAARVHLVRLVAVLAVLAGLVVLHGAPCGDGMATAGPVVASTCSLPGCDGAAEVADSGDHRMSPGSLAGQPSPSSGIPGALMTCLALLVTVLAVMVGLARRRLLTRGVVRPPQPVAAIGHVSWPVPSLAELCVLRT